MESDLLTTTQTAELLKVSTRTVQRYAAEGHLPVAQRITAHRGAYLYRRTDVEALLAEMIPANRIPPRKAAS